LITLFDLANGHSIEPKRLPDLSESEMKANTMEKTVFGKNQPGQRKGGNMFYIFIFQSND